MSQAKSDQATAPIRTLSQSTRASYFISYAHRDTALLALVRRALADMGASEWHDRTHIQVGDLWWDEIEHAIQRADELILLASEHSMDRPVVREEVELAARLGKIVRPILCTESTARVPAWLRRFHCINLGPRPSNGQALGQIQRGLHPKSTEVPGYLIAELKSLAVRQVWPPFGEHLLRGSGAADVAQLTADLTTISRAYSACSTVTLNLGLLHCIGGRWGLGLELLGSYAESSNTMAGWYFFALHLARGGKVSHMPVGDVRRALRAVERASCLGGNPFLTLLQAILETAGANRGHANLQQHLGRFATLWSQCPETAEEGLRMYWCLKKSWNALGPSSRNLALMVTQHDRRS